RTPMRLTKYTKPTMEGSILRVVGYAVVEKFDGPASIGRVWKIDGLRRSRAPWYANSVEHGALGLPGWPATFKARHEAISELKASTPA
ncbi:MAG: hypothetical protein R3301_16260, partial [Saprospiraceae bacterium]|nr:hypothetical protein [Saprospiraceae bacterium]